MGIICKIFGHDWLFPSHKLSFGKGSISAGDYVCRRCGITKLDCPKKCRSMIDVQAFLNDAYGVDNAYLVKDEKKYIKKFGKRYKLVFPSNR